MSRCRPVCHQCVSMCSECSAKFGFWRGRWLLNIFKLKYVHPGHFDRFEWFSLSQFPQFALTLIKWRKLMTRKCAGKKPLPQVSCTGLNFSYIFGRESSEKFKLKSSAFITGFHQFLWRQNESSHPILSLSWR